MAPMRPLLTSASQGRTILVPSITLQGHSLATFNTMPVSLMKFRPLRQPQFNRMGSSASSQTSSTPTPASRCIHSSTTTCQAGASLTPDDTIFRQPSDPKPESSPQTSREAANETPLAILPLRTVLRSLAITTISSSPFLLPPSLAIMGLLAHTTNPLLNPDYNPLLRRLVKSTFYAQFCAGEAAPEVRDNILKLKGLGFSGVILGYAREVVLTDAQFQDLVTHGIDSDVTEYTKSEVIPWANNTLETVRLASEGDYVALKFTGAGRQALWALSQRDPPPPAIADAVEEICALAAARGVRLLFDAEQQAVQHGIDDWTLHYMRKYNKNESKTAVIYGTYQAYLKETPRTLAAHLQIAQREGFTLGVKLVRGAYLGSDPRELIHDTKDETDACYNGIAAALLSRKWSGPLAPHAAPGQAQEDAAFPAVNMVLASHNAETVHRARAILAERAALPPSPDATEVAFAQLQGMADEVSCAILAAKRRDEGASLRAYKYVVWGTTGECMKYLLRRANENKDAVARTRSGRDAMRGEVWRRFKGVFGLA